MFISRIWSWPKKEDTCDEKKLYKEELKGNQKYKFNESKFLNSINSTNFVNLKNKENNEGFEESYINKSGKIYIS